MESSKAAQDVELYKCIPPNRRRAPKLSIGIVLTRWCLFQSPGAVLWSGSSFWTLSQADARR